jgi:ribonucleotide reductase beta subunit family protein with ferritin-like domain
VTSADIQTPTESVVAKYKVPIEYADRQLEIFWLPGEINVEKDVQSILVDMTPAEKHGVLTTLRLFTLYELRAGGEYWGSRFVKTFPRPEFTRMASVFSMFELAVHAPFYAKLNEALNVSTDSFYTSYVEDPDLKERMEFIDKALSDEDDLYSTAVFSLVEGAVLYSAFAFLKHFQANGKNKLNNVCRGIAFSVRDEALHAEAGAWCYRALQEQIGGDVSEKIYDAAKILYQHETLIIDKVFEVGEISGITATQMKHFVEHRIDLCLKNLGLKALYKPKYNPIAEWFYKDITGFAFNDFFAGIGKEYRRDWNEKAFSW